MRPISSWTPFRRQHRNTIRMKKSMWPETPPRNTISKRQFARDNLVVSVVSILIVLVVLLFTFKSAGMPVLLILVIQGSIWINFSLPYLLDEPLFFMSYLVVSSIQMGANIDYAIVVANRYQELKEQMHHRDAIIETMNFAFPTIITSGTIPGSGRHSDRNDDLHTIHHRYRPESGPWHHHFHFAGHVCTAADSAGGRQDRGYDCL